MRIRGSSGELCYPYDEFRTLSVGEVCRRYGWGDSWVDEIRDEQADAQVKATQES